MSALRPSDLEQLAAQGIAPAEAERQLALLADPPAPPALDRPCTVGDGIARIGPDEGRALLELHAEAAERGRVSAFVPASGAATRMFGDLMAVRAEPSLGTPEALAAAARAGRREAAAAREFLGGLDRFAFFPELKRAAEAGGVPLRMLVREGPLETLFSALLDETGLGYGSRPKGLLAFHDYPDGPRTPFEEHLVEATQFAGDGEARCRLHFTVSPEHRAAFEARLLDVAPRLGQRLGAGLDVGFSEQKRSTETLAASPGGGPFRTAEGKLLLRPAGHGALLANLADLDADLVMVKNVDNVAHERFKRDTFTWSRLLIGLAARLEREAVAHLGRLAAGADEAAVSGAERFLATAFGAAAPAAGPLPERTLRAGRRLARPLRVCGMVPSTGEPGGGPMWVRGDDGEVTAQVVELSQVRLDDPGQRAVVEKSTHFNPVFMALALRGAGDRPYRLAEFVDERAVLVVKKSFEGRDLLALERPGLWNGAMARWNTVFVEVPLSVFNPVKSVNDLLRKEHQPG